MCPKKVDHNAVGVVWRPGQQPGANEMLMAFRMSHEMFRALGMPSFEDIPEKLLNSCLPGGGREKDESPEQAFCRELWEETGLTVTDVTHMELVFRRQDWSHVKNGYLVAFRDCKGDVHEKPYWDKKAVFVGYRWITFNEAHQLLSRGGHPGNHSKVVKGAELWLRKQGIEFNASIET